MTYEQITRLLDKYWDGDTSIEEERALKAYFSAGSVDERLQSVAPLFAALRAEQSVILQRDNARQFTEMRVVFSWRRWAAAAALAGLLTAAGWWWLSSRTSDFAPPMAEMPLVPPPPVPASESAAPENPQPRQLAQADTRPVKRPSAVKRPHSASPAPSAAERKEAEQALAEIKAALSLVSSKINKGKQEAAKNLHQIENMDKVFKKKSEG